jgi:hypothetical protein
METSYLTISGQGATRESGLPMLASRPGRPQIAEPTHARIVRTIGNPIGWLSVANMAVQRPAAQQHQGAALAEFGGRDVTDTKFSTRLGPPSCSPPV